MGGASRTRNSNQCYLTRFSGYAHDRPMLTCKVVCKSLIAVSNCIVEAFYPVYPLSKKVTLYLRTCGLFHCDQSVQMLSQNYIFVKFTLSFWVKHQPTTECTSFECSIDADHNGANPSYPKIPSIIHR